MATHVGAGAGTESEHVKCTRCYLNDAVCLLENRVKELRPRCLPCAKLGQQEGERLLQLIYPPEVMAQPTLEERIERVLQEWNRYGGDSTPKLINLIAGVLAVARGKGEFKPTMPEVRFEALCSSLDKFLARLAEALKGW